MDPTLPATVRALAITRRIAAVTLLAGIAAGCSTTASSWSENDANPDASTPSNTTTAQTNPNADTNSGFVRGSDSQGESAVWSQLIAENGETEPGDVTPPIDMFGDIAGRSMTQGLPANGAAYDPADLTRVSFNTVGADFDPIITEDGEFVYFASTRHRETADIYRKHTQSRVVTQITTDPGHDVMPTLSPDGSRIAFASNRQGNWNLYVIDSAGGQARPITDDSAHELHASWSPDGTRLVYCRLGPVSQRWELWLVDVENPMVKQQIGFGLFPEFSPIAGSGTNGADRIVFQRARERGSRLFSIWAMDILESDAGYLTELASNPEAALINPTWSRDGKRVAYASVPMIAASADGKPTKADIWMLNVDGTGETNLTADDAVNLMPTWGENNQIFFISDRSGTDNIWSLAGEQAVIAAGEPYIGMDSRRTASRTNSNRPTSADRKSADDDLGVSSDPAVANFPVGDE